MKRNNKIDYYHNYFETNKNNASSIWKGKRSIVKISKTSRKDIKLLNDNGNTVSDPNRIVELFNKYFVNVGPNIDSKIPKALKHFKDYMASIKTNKTFFLTHASPQELFDIILAFDFHRTSQYSSPHIKNFQ